MQPVTKGWKDSSHSSIACVNCHVESTGVFAFVLHKIAAYKEPFFEITRKYKEGINRESEISEEMSDEHCTVCHSKKRKVTPSEGLVFSNKAHEEHKKLHLKCAFCHNRVGHETEDHKNHLNMEWCLEECHSGETFIQECTVCHTEDFAKKNKKKKVIPVKKKKRKKKKELH